MSPARGSSRASSSVWTRPQGLFSAREHVEGSTTITTSISAIGVAIAILLFAMYLKKGRSRSGKRGGFVESTQASETTEEMQVQAQQELQENPRDEKLESTQASETTQEMQVQVQQELQAKPRDTELEKLREKEKLEAQWNAALLIQRLYRIRAKHQRLLTGMFIHPSETEEIVILKQKLHHFEAILKNDGAWTEDDQNMLKDLTDEVMKILKESIRKTEEDNRVVKSFVKKTLDGEGYTFSKWRADREGFSDFGNVDKIIETIEERNLLSQDDACLQPMEDLIHIFLDASKMITKFESAMDQIVLSLKTTYPSIELKKSPLKLLYRTMEKMAFSTTYLNRADGVLDIVRCRFICDSVKTMVGVLSFIFDSELFEFVRFKDRWRHPTTAGWADFMINVYLKNGASRHKCEIQITHKLMMAVSK